MFFLYPTELLLLRFREDFAFEQTLFIVPYKFFSYSDLQGICQVIFGLYIQTSMQLRLIKIFLSHFAGFFYVFDSKFCFDDRKTSIVFAAANSHG